MEIKDNFTVGFIGLGLIGGSIAKAIRRVYPNYRIIGYDTDQEALESALTEHILDEKAYLEDGAFSSCNYIFLCAPVSYNLEYLKDLKPILKPGCILTDVGSVKGPIHKAVRELAMEEVFIGGHPMVGSEKAGYSHCTDRLIENAYYFITPTKKMAEEKVTEFSQFIEELGAMTILLDPDRHDSITASISHVPHIVAAELVHLVKNMDDSSGMLKQLAAGGFKDITRIASSSPTVWEQISMENVDNIRSLLISMITDLQKIVDALGKKDGHFVYDYFKEAGEYRALVPDNAVGLMQKTYELFVDIPDEPGTLAATTTFLALHNISIKNVGIIHNREYEEGVFKIVLYDDESAKKAYKILKDRNYDVHIRH
ncbi:MAG: prephenate dehydrogenase [Lachnospiraceae bacterium]|nr:prephenate dehydrogenase [Lachnospiraceae bacterium]